MHDHLTLFTRIGNGRLGLKVKLLLASAGERAAQLVLSSAELRVNVTPCDSTTWPQELLPANGFRQIEDRLRGATLNADCLTRPFKRFGSFSCTNGYWLAQIQNFAVDQE